MKGAELVACDQDGRDLAIDDGRHGGLVIRDQRSLKTSRLGVRCYCFELLLLV